MVERELPLFPLHVVLFPGMRLPLHVFEDRYKQLVGTCMVADRTFGIVLIKSGQEVGGPAEVFSVGTTARIAHLERLPEGRMNLVALGVERFRLLERLDGRPYPAGRVELISERPEPVTDRLTARVAGQFRRYLLGRGVPEGRLEALDLPEDPDQLSYLVAAALEVSARKRQRLLEDDSATTRLRRELAFLELMTGGPSQDLAGTFSLN